MATESAPKFLVVVVYENDKTDVEFLEGLLNRFCPLPGHPKTLAHSLKFSPDMLQHPGKFLSDENLSERVKTLTTVIENTLFPPDEPLSNSSMPLVMLIGLGFGALVAMEAMRQSKLFISDHRGIITMGMVLSSVPLNSKTGDSPTFKSWYNTLQDDQNDDTKFLRLHFQGFNRFCLKHHIRVSCITRKDQNEQDFISKHIRCARLYVKVQGNGPDLPDPKLHIFLEHVNSIFVAHVKRSWPEHLLQLIQDEGASEAEIRRLIRTHWGGHSHEPIVARVLEKAASANKLKIVQDLLKDKVHPDVRVSDKDQTAFASSKGLSEMQRLLYRHGAKEYSSTPRLRLWGNSPDKLGESEGAADRQNQPSNTTESGKHEKSRLDNIDSDKDENEKPEFRGLIVDIYYPEPKIATKTEQEKGSCCNGDKGQGSFSETPKPLLNHEFHSIAHPTVEELVYTKGPSEIMGSNPPTPPEGSAIGQYKRTRWIHLPMNHMTWLRDLVEMVCNEKCPQLEAHKKAARDYDRGSTEACSEECKNLNYKGKEADFPRWPGCADALFDSHYWLGHQNTRGTEEHSHIRYLRPQFRRLGMEKSKRTGFMVALPYVHFDTYKDVLGLKNKAAQLKKAKVNLTDPNYPLPLDEDEKTWENETGGVMSDDIDNEKVRIDSEKRVPSTTLGVIHKDLYSALPVHYRRTLSQFYFNSKLQRTKQVVTEHFENHWPDREALTLMVDQLWMLVLVDGTIITCFSSQMGGRQELFPYIYTDLVEGLLNSLRSEWRCRIESVLDVGYIIIQECIGFLFNQRARYNVCFRFLNIYEQQLSEVAASEAGWFEELSNLVAALPNPSEAHRYEKEAHNCLQKLLQLDKKTNVMDKIKRLKQIRRELNVLREVVATQVRVIKQMTDELEATEEFDWSEFTNSPRLKSRRQRRATKLEARSRTLSNLENKAESIIHNLELFITRKEQQVQNLQSYFSSRLADRSTRMEVIILVLTVVTTLFAPLSFITTFLALQITEFPHNATGDNVSMPLSFASTWVFGLGLSVVIMILVPAITKAFDFRRAARELMERLLAPPPLRAQVPAASHYDGSITLPALPPAPGEDGDELERKRTNATSITMFWSKSNQNGGDADVEKAPA